MNTNGFTQWKKELKKGELANYTAYMRGEDRLAIFDSGDSLREHFYHNVDAFGGNGTWTSKNFWTPKSAVDKVWTFGTDFPSFDLTAEAIREGRVGEKYLDRVEKVKSELYEKYPRLHELAQIAIVKKRRRRFNEDEGELDIDRYMSGDPAMFASMPRMSIKGKSATFYIELGMSHKTDAMATAEGVISALALIEIVERAGISTEIIVGATSNNAVQDARLLNVSMIAKKSDEPLDTSRLLSFALTGMFRQFIFGVRENMTDSFAYSSLGKSSWRFEENKEFFDFFEALIKFRVRDAYWRNDQMSIMIDQVFEFLGETSPALSTLFCDQS
jgi:hypothetical protein